MKVLFVLIIIGLISCDDSNKVSINIRYSHDAKFSQLPDSVKKFISNAQFLQHSSTTYGYYLYNNIDSFRYKFLTEPKYVLTPWIFEVYLYDSNKDIMYSLFGADRTPTVLFGNHLYIPNYSGVPGMNFDTNGYYFRVYNL